VKGVYNLSMARTKDVSTAGRKTQNHADQKMRKPMHITEDIRNAIQ
jgi:hypothetical protein